jgi:hypothetical protein
MVMRAIFRERLEDADNRGRVDLRASAHVLAALDH